MPRFLLVHDYETTGLTLHPDADLALQPRAIEFAGAMIDCDIGGVAERVTFLINPGKPLEPIITKITGITDAVLAAEPTAAARLPELRRVYGAAAAMLSHNLPFDRAILAHELARLGVNDFPWPAQELCTVGLYKEHWGRNPKLTELYEHVMGKPLAQTHRAMDDVDALVEIVHKEELWKLVH